MLPVVELKDLYGKERREYFEHTNLVTKSELVKNELNRIKNEAGMRLVRQTNVNSDIAFNRGIIHAVDTLEKRFAYLRQLNTKADKKS
jgi:hypothetical protein